ncbi:neuronal acetylcholine receptor subunit alpha-7-like [Pecten maximus]|uniref:neuronal acetylcholine receptor subunit alpha-7-like n=1 Tax=Pecten maximus TaxID=6579 RepID=UPI001458D717|nr:neuronal acetylcholine receptor subunit alpha-7-like [Pecten maximus]
MDDLMRLKDTLFQNYTKDFRPVYNLSEPTHVTLSMYLITILDLDEITGTITLNCGLMVLWSDYRLVWNSSDFGGISSFVFNSSNVWKPRIYFTTSSDDLSDFSYDAFDVRVFSNGSVLSSPGRNVRASCMLDMTKFPKDSQTCVLQVMAWMLPASEMVFVIGSSDIDLSYYKPNGEWDIDRTSIANNNDFGTEYSLIDFTIHLSRRYAYFLVSMASPILFLCFLNPFVFLIPVSSGERISFTITMFLSLAVYMTLIGENMPHVSDPMAAISYFLLLAMLYSSVVIILTIFTLRCDAVKDVHEFPRWLLWLVRCGRRKKLADPISKGSSASKSSDIHAKEYGEATDERKVLGNMEQEKSIRKEDVMNFIEKSLFCFTLSLMCLMWFVFWMYYWM